MLTLFRRWGHVQGGVLHRRGLWGSSPCYYLVAPSGTGVGDTSRAHTRAHLYLEATASLLTPITIVEVGDISITYQA